MQLLTREEITENCHRDSSVCDACSKLVMQMTRSQESMRKSSKFFTRARKFRRVMKIDVPLV